MFGSSKGNRNNDCFFVGCELARAGYTYEEAFARIARVIDLTDSELHATIKQAFLTVNKGV
jgi:hypothetical protein